MHKTQHECGRPLAAGICLLFAIAGLLIAGGCISVPIPEAEMDPTRFYVLNAGSGGREYPRADAAPTQAPSIQLQPVEIASYLRTKAMVVRRGENEIEFREFARWGEPLETGIARVLREELLAGGKAKVSLASRVRPVNPEFDYTLTVRVLACEGGADGSVDFRAAWELAPTAGTTAGTASGGRPGEVAVRDFQPANLRWDGKSEAALAAQLSDAVVGLAREISAAIAEK